MIAYFFLSIGSVNYVTMNNSLNVITNDLVSFLKQWRICRGPFTIDINRLGLRGRGSLNVDKGEGVFSKS